MVVPTTAQAEAVFEALARTSLEAKLVHRAYRPLYANPAFADMFLFDDADDALAQRSLLSLFDADTRANPDAAWSRLIGQAGATFGRRRFNRRNGALFRAEFVARRITWHDGEPAVAIALIDVSAEEHACCTLAAARAEADVAARAQRGLYTAAARSLAPPLRRAKAHLKALSQTEDGAEAAHEALTACDDLLTRVAHVGALLHDEAAERFDLHALLTQAGDRAAGAHPELRLDMRVGCAPGLHVLGASSRVTRVAEHLIEAAGQRARDVHFAASFGAHGLELEIEARAIDAGAPRADDEHLCAARALIEAEGGLLVTRNAARDYWTAQALLPIAPAAERVSATAARDVLVVEDNTGAMRLMRTLLGALGHRVTGVGAGADAVAAVAAQRFDLVLMDIHLPGMDGFEAARRIRALPRPWAGLPIAAMTASASQGLQAAAAEAGMDAFLVKPIEAARLAEQIALLTGVAGLIHAAELNEIEHEDHRHEAADQIHRSHAFPRAAQLSPNKIAAL